MHPQQRHARFNLVVIGTACILYGILVSIVGTHHAVPALGVFGMLGVLGFSSQFYRRKKTSPAVVMDERDLEIKRKASLVGWGVTWLYWGLACMGPWFAISLGRGIEHVREPAIPVFWLPMAYMAAMIVFQLAWSGAVLVLYKKGAQTDEG